MCIVTAVSSPSSRDWKNIHILSYLLGEVLASALTHNLCFQRHTKEMNSKKAPNDTMSLGQKHFRFATLMWRKATTFVGTTTFFYHCFVARKRVPWLWPVTTTAIAEWVAELRRQNSAISNFKCVLRFTLLCGAYGQRLTGERSSIVVATFCVRDIFVCFHSLYCFCWNVI